MIMNNLVIVYIHILVRLTFWCWLIWCIDFEETGSPLCSLFSTSSSSSSFLSTDLDRLKLDKCGYIVISDAQYIIRFLDFNSLEKIQIVNQQNFAPSSKEIFSTMQLNPFEFTLYFFATSDHIRAKISCTCFSAFVQLLLSAVGVCRPL